MESGTQVRIIEPSGTDLSVVDSHELNGRIQDGGLIDRSLNLGRQFVILSSSSDQNSGPQPQTYAQVNQHPLVTIGKLPSDHLSPSQTVIVSSPAAPMIRQQSLLHDNQMQAQLLATVTQHQQIHQHQHQNQQEHQQMQQNTQHFMHNHQNLLLLGQLAHGDGVSSLSNMNSDPNSASIEQHGRSLHGSGGSLLDESQDESRPILLLQNMGADQIENRNQIEDSLNMSLFSVASESDGRHEPVNQTLYPIQYVPADFSSGDMLYTTTSGPSIGAGHHNVHQLQSTGPTYAVYQTENAYGSHVSYYQNQSLAYQQQQAVLQAPNQQQAYGLGHGGVALQEEETTAQQLSHTTRASPATIQWLLHNYETAEGVSLPRCTLYGHYLRHCSENRLDPVNAASFGKLIRSVFLGLRTRRLGTRGNSKYHYYGIRIKPESPLNRVPDDSVTMAMRQQPSNTTRRNRTTTGVQPTNQAASQSPTNAVNFAPGQAGGVSLNRQGSCLQGVGPTNFVDDGGNNGGLVDAQHVQGTQNGAQCPAGVAQATEQQQKGLLGIGSVPIVAPPPLEALKVQLDRVGLTMTQANKFFVGYKQHCEDILECITNLQFSDVECCWRQFWQTNENNVLDSGEDDSSNSFSDINLTGLNRTQLYTICIMPQVLEYMQTMDFQFYQVILDVLIPNVLKSIPSSLTQSIRNFAKRLENSLAVTLLGAPEVVIKLKLDAISTLAQTIRRYTSLNHLAQAARAVLQNQSQISQMLTDLNRVDFKNIHEQASWVCFCNSAKVDEIEKSFKQALESQKSLEQLAEWSRMMVEQVLSNHRNLIHFSRQFLLKWSFYSSLVMRDLTLRSAPSFGSFHLIRLLFDEYIFFLVEQLVARSMGRPTLAIMSQTYRHHVHACDFEPINFDEIDTPTRNQRPPYQNLPLADQHTQNQNFFIESMVQSDCIDHTGSMQAKNNSALTGKHNFHTESEKDGDVSDYDEDENETSAEAEFFVDNDQGVENQLKQETPINSIPPGRRINEICDNEVDQSADFFPNSTHMSTGLMCHDADRPQIFRNAPAKRSGGSDSNVLDTTYSKTPKLE